MTGMDVACLARLSKICALLASPFDGERAVAALKATQLLEDHGLRWADLVLSAFGGAMQDNVPDIETAHNERQPGWHVSYCAVLLSEFGEKISKDKWKMEFLSNLMGKFKDVSLTEKQTEKLREIAAKYGMDV